MDGNEMMMTRMMVCLPLLPRRGERNRLAFFKEHEERVTRKKDSRAE
jgi:hypothetical protein